MREGSLEAPTRHPLDWKNPDFYKEEKLFEEMERIFEICHGFRLIHQVEQGGVGVT